MRNLTHLANRLYGAPWLIHPDKLETLSRVFAEHLSVKAGMFDEDEENTPPVAAKPYPVDDDGIATFRILGTTVRRATGMRAMSGVASYAKISQDFAAAVADPEVKGIMLDVDSPGGEAGGCFDLADQIFQARDSKPVYASANENMFSAAYALGSSAEKLFLGRTAGVGSIGVLMMHTDISKAVTDAGVKVTFIKAGDKKVDGNQFEPYSTRAQADDQAHVDEIYDIFAATVARNRGMSVKAVKATEAGLYHGADAVAAGLADQIGAFDDAMGALRVAIGATGTGTNPEDANPEGPLDDDDGEDPARVEQMRKEWNSAYKGTANAAYVPVFAKDGTVEEFACGPMDGGGAMAALANRSGVAGYMEFRQISPAGKTLFVVRHFRGAALSTPNGEPRITGCPVPYNSLSRDLGGFREIYAPGCFTESIANDDIMALSSHDFSHVLGRKSAGTLLVSEDTEGVQIDARPPSTTWAKDLQISMGRGDITQMSASFYILRQRWEMRSGERVRVVEKARMVESSVHSFPAYTSTSAKVTTPDAEQAAIPAAQTNVSHEHLRARLELLKSR